MNISSDLPLVTAYISLPSMSSYNTKELHLCLPSVPDTNNQQTSNDFKACGNCVYSVHHLPLLTLKCYCLYREINPFFSGWHIF